MDKTVLHGVQLEQMPTNFGRIHDSSHKKHWATIIILLIVILFGTYWLIEQKHIPSPALPLASYTPKAEPSEISSLETALAHTVIPELSTLF